MIQTPRGGFAPSVPKVEFYPPDPANINDFKRHTAINILLYLMKHTLRAEEYQNRVDKYIADLKELDDIEAETMATGSDADE